MKSFFVRPARRAACFLSLAVSLAASPWCFAQTAPAGYPGHAIRVIVPAASGSLTDPVGRIVAEEMARRTGQSWIIDNRPGAGGIIGSDVVAKAPADGYTLLFTANNFIITPSLYAKVPYRIPDDFTSIGLVGRADNLLVVSAVSGIRNINELVARAKSASKPFEYTSPLLGSAAHLTVELFARNAGIKLQHIAYKDSGQGTTDTLAGRIPVNVMGISTALPHIRAGRLVPLAWTGARRAPELPDTPTFVEAGYKDVHMGLWFGFVGPAKMPADVVAYLNQQLNAALGAPAVLERLGAMSVAPMPGTAQAMSQLIATELPVYSKLAADTGIKLD